MSIELYGSPGSAPCRSVLLVAKALNVKVTQKEVNILEGGQLKPEYLKLNPQHTIPTIVDGGFVLWESRSILRYLANKYGKDSTLYPADPEARARVDQRLDFDLGTLNARFANYFYPQVKAGEAPNEENLKKLKEALGFLNDFLEGLKFAAGPNMTIADLSLVSTVSTMEMSGFNAFKEYPNVLKWYNLVISTAPGYAAIRAEADKQYKNAIALFKARQAANK